MRDCIFKAKAVQRVVAG